MVPGLRFADMLGAPIMHDLETLFETREKRP